MSKFQPTHWEYRQRETPAYRDNPNNIYHDTYQTAVNRWTVFSVLVMLFTLHVVEFGWESTAVVIVLSIYGAFAVFVVYFVLRILYKFLSDKSL